MLGFALETLLIQTHPCAGSFLPRHPACEGCLLRTACEEVQSERLVREASRLEELDRKFQTVGVDGIATPITTGTRPKKKPPT